ncbi:hypothetical protein G3N64_03465, partial [Burkholderia sp. Ac-20344]|nr:hypothetical protein [Burkholderia sp. Ac-20344]
MAGQSCIGGRSSSATVPDDDWPDAAGDRAAGAAGRLTTGSTRCGTDCDAGAGSGLGAAVARMVIAEGGKAVLLDVNEEAGAGLAHELGAAA